MPECNGCTFCCKVLGIPELKKMPNQWCDHCAIGRGCTIYDTRPTSCVEFVCFYRGSEGPLPIALRPDKCKVVIAPTTNERVISAHVDAGMPHAWKREPVYSLLKKFAESGLIVVISHGMSVDKIALKKLDTGIVGQIPIKMSTPDENGMQWYDDRLLPKLPESGIVMTHYNINVPKPEIVEVQADEVDMEALDTEEETIHE